MWRTGGGVSLAVAVLAGPAVPASADERRFTYSYEAKTLPEGSMEFEQWVTMRARKEKGVFRHWDLREEFEYGVTDLFTAALYLNFEYEAHRNVPGKRDTHEVEFEGVSVEGKYKLTDPSVDLVGSLLYGEISVGGDEFELEGKAVFSKALGNFIVAYNFIVEWEKEEEKVPSGGKEWESELVISNTVGISWTLGGGWAAGVEALSHTDFEHSFSHSEHTAYFAGPNVHHAAGGWWVTLTALKQVDLQEHTGLIFDGHEKYEVRLVVGISF